MVKLSRKFWAELEARYPAGTDHFYNWVYNYKTSVGWDQLFQTDKSGDSLSYFDLPIAMQMGIFLQYASGQGRPVPMTRIDSLKDFYQLSAVIESFIGAYIPSTGPRLDDPGVILGFTRMATGFIPDAYDSQGGSFEGGGGEFSGGGASGEWTPER